MSDFTITLPDVPRGQMPPGIDTSPMAAEASEYRRLLALFDDVRAELRSIRAERPQAAEKDRLALAQAMADGKKDPGDRETAALHARFVAKHREATGLADATKAALTRLWDAIDTHAATWRDQLAAEVDDVSRDVDGLLGKLMSRAAESDGPRSAARWLTRALERGHDRRRDSGGGLPSVTTPIHTVSVGGAASIQRQQLLDAFAESIGAVPELAPSDPTGPDDRLPPYLRARLTAAGSDPAV